MSKCRFRFSVFIKRGREPLCKPLDNRLATVQLVPQSFAKPLRNQTRCCPHCSTRPGLHRVRSDPACGASAPKKSEHLRLPHNIPIQRTLAFSYTSALVSVQIRPLVNCKSPVLTPSMFWSHSSDSLTTNEVHCGPDAPLLTLAQSSGGSKLSISAFLQRYCPTVYPAYCPSKWLPKYTIPVPVHCCPLTTVLVDTSKPFTDQSPHFPNTTRWNTRGGT